MHQALAARIVQNCRQRYEDGDCPLVKQPSPGIMEDCIRDLADEIDDAMILLSRVIAGQPCDEAFVKRCTEWATRSYGAFNPVTNEVLAVSE